MTLGDPNFVLDPDERGWSFEESFGFGACSTVVGQRKKSASALVSVLM